MKIAIAGAGAMGCRFGYMLQNAQQDITLIDMWKPHVDTINTQGLRVEDATGETYYTIPTLFPHEVKDSYDLIIMFTKTMQLESMLKAIESIFDKNTAIIVLSNGLGNIETLKHYAKDAAVYAGVTLWSCELEGPGHIRATGSGSIEFQPLIEREETRPKRILEVLNKAHLNAQLSENVVLSIWKKAAFNSVLNTYCTLLDCNVGTFGTCKNAMSLAEKVVDEFVNVAQAQSIPLNHDMVLDTIKKVFDPSQSGDHYPSMHQDISKGRKTEVDYLNGAVVKMGKEANIKVPMNTLLTELIHAKEDVLGIKD